MVNSSIATRLLEDTYDETGKWIVVYDFIEEKPSPNFWSNLQRISSELGGFRVQYSVYSTKRLREARAVTKLVTHYGGEAIMYRINELNR